MKHTATELRAHLYEILDRVATTGKSVDIARKGVALQIVRVAPAAPKPGRRTKPRTLAGLINGNPDDLVHIEWPWSEGRDL